MKVLMPYMLTMTRRTRLDRSRSCSLARPSLARASSRGRLSDTFSHRNFGNGRLLVYHVVLLVDENLAIIAVNIARLFGRVCKLKR
jgi:hypothetical protein